MDTPDPVADRAGLWIVILCIGMLLTWAATANLLGGLIGFAAAVGVGIVAGCCAWHERITYDLLSNVALVGVPIVMIGLTLA
jgi:ABC-type nitrate/sulfonate/bicarbonate transport system permease component